MKNIYCILLVCISIISFNCQKEVSFTTGNFNHNSVSTGTATLQGNVFDENAKPAIGVVVKAGTKSAVTDARGYFRIVNAVVDKNASLVTAEKKGYFISYRTFIATSGVNQLMIKLVPRNLSGSIPSTAGGEITLANGSKILLPSNGIVKGSGGSYSGTVNVYASYINPASPDIAQTVPGSFMADDKDNKRVFLTSYGMLAVELESSSGEKLQIASGSTATLTMPIPSSIQSTAPASVSLWYIDEQTGVWKEEGTATKTGNSYVGQVKHFSFWNCDFGGAAVKLSVTLQTLDGQPLVYVHVSINSTTAGQAHGWTDSLGQVSGLVPANEPLVLSVMDQCYKAIYSQNIGPFSSSADLGVIRLTAGPSVTTIKGKLLDCNSAAVANGEAVIYYDYLVRYVKADASGDFATSFTSCSSSPLSCQVLGVDNATQQQGAVVNVTVTSPVTNAGNISACGTSALQYINYTVDGVDYSISSTAASDSLTSYNYDSSGVTGTFISGFHPSNTTISFGFNNNGTEGIYPLTLLYVQNSSGQLVQPFDVIITRFARKTGEMCEGTFSGQFTDLYTPSTTHTITCSFRVRR